MISNILIVAAGSAFGGVLRYLVAHVSRGLPARLPYWTLAVNVVGSLLIGMGAAAFAGSERSRLLLLTGFCGGFTTFSAFSFETLELFQREAPGWALANIAANVVLSLLACWAGWAIASRH